MNEVTASHFLLFISRSNPQLRRIVAHSRNLVLSFFPNAAVKGILGAGTDTKYLFQLNVQNSFAIATKVLMEA